MKLSYEELQAERQAIVAEARTWMRTPYHHEARVKGAGVDCVQILAAVFSDVGLIPPPKIDKYPHDWHLHRNAELYLKGLFQYAVETKNPQPGDVALFKFARCFSHGSIVVEWPTIIHAYLHRPVTEEDASKNMELALLGSAPRPVRFFTLKRWAV